MSEKDEKEVNKLIDAMKECHLSSASNETNVSTVIFGNSDSTLHSKWPALYLQVPDIFLHKTVDFKEHVLEVLSMEIKFYQLYKCINNTKIKCPTFNDHKALTQYLDNHQLPYHTFGHPDNRQLKVVIRGLPKNIDLEVLKKELETALIPITTIHRMHRRENVKDALVLAVSPHNEEGRKLIEVTKILGYDVKIEPLRNKVQQCHRCQIWGHTQRYCHGQIKCVKCGGEHLSEKCEGDPSKDPPKCANCGGDHTANFRQCPYCPNSFDHYISLIEKRKRNASRVPKRRELVTLENYNFLYISDNPDEDSSAI